MQVKKKKKQESGQGIILAIVIKQSTFTGYLK